MKEKKYLIYGIILVIITAIGLTYAYFETNIEGDRKVINVTWAELKIIFNNGDSITGTNIKPGWSQKNSFSVENTTRDTYKYNIVIEDLVNTFVTTGFLKYKVTSTDGGYNMTEYIDVPKSSTKTNTTLAYNVEIPGNTTHNYQIEFIYEQSTDVNQSADMKKLLQGNLYIEKGGYPSLSYMMLKDNPTISERTDFSVVNTSNTTGTLYKTNKTEDGSDVYYYSGNTTNNWVKFGKYQVNVIKYRGYNYSDKKLYYKEYNTLEECTSATSSNINCTAINYGIKDNDMYWRIIRTNEDGSVRLLYAGTSPDTTLSIIGIDYFNEGNDSPMYFGYMYGTAGSLENNRLNTTDSTIKAHIDTWYENNLLTNYDKFLSKSAIYCNDRSVGSGTYTTDNSAFHMGATQRLTDNNKISYKCGANASDGLFESTQAIGDKFSASTTGGGNGQLKYPVALMTADEVVFAGASKYKSLESPYAWYYTNSLGNSNLEYADWFTLSPASWYGGGTYLIGIDNTQNVGYLRLNFGSINGIRPVISLDKCAGISSGDGTSTNPYVIDESSCTN